MQIRIRLSPVGNDMRPLYSIGLNGQQGHWWFGVEKAILRHEADCLLTSCQLIAPKPLSSWQKLKRHLFKMYRGHMVKQYEN